MVNLVREARESKKKIVLSAMVAMLVIRAAAFSSGGRGPDGQWDPGSFSSDRSCCHCDRDRHRLYPRPGGGSI